MNNKEAQTVGQNLIISAFENSNIEIIMKEDSPYFKLTDIEKVLELSKGCSSQWLKDGWFDEDEIELRISQLGGHSLKYVAESGLYRILNRTNSPKARPFERWVTKEVLPAIRKNSNDIKDRDKFLPKVENNQNALIQAFENSNIEIIMKEDSPYFKLADIEKVLELSDSASSRWIKDGWFDEDELTLWNSQGGGLPRNYVAESGLYRILNRTNSPKARPFERWVTKEVLPQIRKTGSYNFKPMTLKESLQLNLKLVEENERLMLENKEQAKLIDDLGDKIDKLNETVAEQDEELNRKEDELIRYEFKVEAYDMSADEWVRRKELRKKFVETINKLAEARYQGDYRFTYNHIYSRLRNLHHFKWSGKDKMVDWLEKNPKYLKEAIRIAASELP